MLKSIIPIRRKRHPENDDPNEAGWNGVLITGGVAVFVLGSVTFALLLLIRNI